ncbi:MAG: glycosyltransferase family 2 protein, partial [Deltaproteobacteria bacterium]|nr:glycosyltransferase family 2 protein [Deltaproteobacteria bacterium]
MPPELKIAIAIPVYNHAGTLRDVVQRALKVHDHVLVVDDGSTDGGVDTLGALPVEILRHGENKGKGAAIQTAARKAGLLGMSHIVTMDGDGQHDPADFPGFLPLIKKHPHAIVVGKRIFKGPNIPKGRRFHRGISNFWFRVQTGRSMGDTQSGYRAYPLF